MFHPGGRRGLLPLSKSLTQFQRYIYIYLQIKLFAAALPSALPAFSIFSQECCWSELPRRQEVDFKYNLFCMSVYNDLSRSISVTFSYRDHSASSFCKPCQTLYFARDFFFFLMQGKIWFLIQNVSAGNLSVRSGLRYTTTMVPG